MTEKEKKAYVKRMMKEHLGKYMPMSRMFIIESSFGKDIHTGLVMFKDLGSRRKYIVNDNQITDITLGHEIVLWHA